jgi:uncharacterized membrane protein YfcA
MEFELPLVIALLGGGFVAGFVNTVAGGGSVITIPILIEVLGGNAVLANGTNRVAILLQNIVGVTAFKKGGKLEFKRVLPVVPALLLGSVAGAWLGTEISPGAMKKVFALVILLVAAMVVVKPKRWLGGREASLREPWRFLVFFAAGFYGGFIQAGVGFILLAGLVLGGGFDLVKGNAAKLLLVLIYTPVTLLLFANARAVDLAAGLVLGVGNMTGALVATNLAIKRGAGWIRWVLLAAALGAAARMLLL